MKTQRFKNDDEYFEYVRKTAKDERILYYTYVIFGIFMIAMVVDITLFTITKINTDIETLAVVVVLSTIGTYKLKKSGWLEKQEEKYVQREKTKLEKRRQRFAERGAEWIIKESEKNLKGVMMFGAYSMLIVTSLFFIPNGSSLIHAIEVLALAISIGTIFVVSKYFKFLINKIMEPYKRDVSEGYLYYKS